MGWTATTDKSEFIGRKACLDAMGKPPGKKLTCLTLEDLRATLLGYEPIYREDRCVGHTKSGNYGYAVGRVIAFGYLPARMRPPEPNWKFIK